MKYCGICHTDVHFSEGGFPGVKFPLVPGHELAGTVVEVGPKVTKFKVGDNVGVGCIVDSCLDCQFCKEDDEQYCAKGMSMTYNSDKKHGHIGGNQDTQNFGGYTGSQVTHEHFVCKIPDSIPLERAGPIMCAGITLYDPLKHWGALNGKKMTIGIVGIGGLGTMGIKMANAMGHRVVAISSSDKKKEMALQKGASAYVSSSDPESLAAETNKIDLILNTVSANH